MVTLEQVTRGAVITGVPPRPDQAVTVMDVSWLGADCLMLVGQSADGTPITVEVRRGDEAGLSLVLGGENWSYRPPTQTTQPTLTGLILQGTYRGGDGQVRMLTACIQEDGRVRCNGVVYDSPTMAARAARANVRRFVDTLAQREDHVDAWQWWQFQDVDGTLRYLSVLRNCDEGDE